MSCGTSFNISDDDLKFYEKISPMFAGKTFSIPAPSLCPPCRSQRRHARFNYEFLYQRTSSKTGNKIVSVVSEDKPYLVYEPKEWWGDDWDAFDYGRDFDFNKEFFAQFHELQKEVPIMSLVIDSQENAEYTQYSGWDKNCYLCFCTDYCEDCMYTHSVYYSKNTLDCFFCYTLELCYECVYCNECHNLLYAQNCNNCSDSAFLFDCQNCNHCFGCVGLRNADYHFFNEKLSKEQYEKKIRKYDLQKYSSRFHVQKKFDDLLSKHPRRPYIGFSVENVSGDYLFNCKNCTDCFDCKDLEDAKHCNSIRGGSDVYDISHWGHPAELCYESAAIGEGADHLLFCDCCWPNCSNLLYCNNCISCRDCFGCVGLKHKSYCILNKQYAKEEYESLAASILKNMQKTKEWGEFFPVNTSIFCYNESPAQKYYPLTKEQITERGWRYKVSDDSLPEVEKTIDAERLPDSIEDIPDDILNWALVCTVTKKPFKLIKQELEYYRKRHLPVPRIHPDERLRIRMLQRNPRHLCERECMKCRKKIQTTYAPERPEIVYCEECYLKEVY
jgi:hypothetical protein